MNGRRRGGMVVGGEPLEKRLPMAGDVGLFVYSGNLRVVGDAAANDVSIVQTAAGEFSIVGNGGESFTLNGVAATGPVAVTGITKAITVALGGGNDAVSITGLSAVTTLAGRLTVLAGPGADGVSVSSARIGGPLTIEAGIGDAVTDGDTVSVSAVTVAGPLVVNAGLGDDTVSIDGVIGRQGVVNTGDGADAVSIAGSTAVAFESLAVALGNGDDAVTIGSGTLAVSKRRSPFAGGAGADSLAGQSNLTAGSLGRLVLAGFESVS